MISFSRQLSALRSAACRFRGNSRVLASLTSELQWICTRERVSVWPLRRVTSKLTPAVGVVGRNENLLSRLQSSAGWAWQAYAMLPLFACRAAQAQAFLKYPMQRRRSLSLPRVGRRSALRPCRTQSIAKRFAMEGKRKPLTLFCILSYPPGIVNQGGAKKTGNDRAFSRLHAAVPASRKAGKMFLRKPCGCTVPAFRKGGKYACVSPAEVPA